MDMNSSEQHLLFQLSVQQIEITNEILASFSKLIVDKQTALLIFPISSSTGSETLSILESDSYVPYYCAIRRVSNPLCAELRCMNLLIRTTPLGPRMRVGLLENTEALGPRTKSVDQVE